MPKALPRMGHREENPCSIPGQTFGAAPEQLRTMDRDWNIQGSKPSSVFCSRPRVEQEQQEQAVPIVRGSLS